MPVQGGAERVQSVEPMSIVVHFDGLCQPKNPGGVATFGFTVDRDGKRIHEDCGLAARPYTEEATNNVAEYTGVLKAVEWLAGAGFLKEPIVVRGDSELVIKQLQGKYKVKSPLLAPIHGKLRQLSAKFSSLTFDWVPREANRDADALTNRAYAEFVGKAMRAPISSVMTVHLIVAAPRERVAAAFRQAGLMATVESLPDATRVQVDVPAELEAVRKVLDLKSKLEE